MNVRRRSAVLLSAALLTCAAVPALAHDGQDTRSGAARMDLEVLLTPALQGETSPGGQDSSVSVDRFGNVVASALKEQAFRAVSPDGRATTKTRLASWRWSSGENGESFPNVGTSPAGVDTLVSGGLSTAVGAPAIAFGRDALLRMTWSSTKVTVPGSSSPLVRNIWSVRTLSP